MRRRQSRHATQRQSPAGRLTSDGGAVAVEFALLLPVLLLLVFGIIDFGRAINAQITLSQAAREGARIASVGGSNVVTGTKTAATGLSGLGVTVSTCPGGTTSGCTTPVPATCPAGASSTGLDVVVRVTYTYSLVTPIGAISRMFGSSFGTSMALTATGVMPCET